MPAKDAVHYPIPTLLILAASLAYSEGSSDDMKPGLVRVHFDQSGFNRPRDSSIESQISFDTGTEHSDYSRIYSGNIRIPTSSEIRFSAEADGGLVLKIGGEKVIDGWTSGEREGTLTAREGDSLPLKLEFDQRGGRPICGCSGPGRATGSN